MNRAAAKIIVTIGLTTLLFQSAFSQEKSTSISEVEESLISLFNRVSQSVVAIHCKAGVVQQEPGRPRRGLRMPQGVPQESTGYFGTGVIYTADGYIITSTSVVPEGGKEIKVTMQDGKEFTARLIGIERRNNLSLIKIDCENLPYAKLGESSSISPGDLAFTIGNPYDSIKNDCQPSFSMGTVSAVYCLRGGDGEYTGQVIETDAALNAGSDGGPLFNVKGEVIGILNLSYSYSRWLSVAVPIDQIKFILDDVKSNKEIDPKYGFVRADTSLPAGGVPVEKIAKNGPAAKAGLQVGDIILEIAGKKVRKPEQLEKEQTLFPPGTKVPFLVKRGEQELLITIITDKIVRERKEENIPTESTKLPEKAPGYLGIVAADEDPQPGPGILVGSVRTQSPAEKAGVKPGDRVLEIEGKPVKTYEDVKEVLKMFHAGDRVKLLILRGEEKLEIETTLTTKPEK